MFVYTSGGVFLVDVFTRKKGFLSQKEVLTKALKTKGVKLATPLLACRFYHSEPIFSIEFNEATIAILRQNGFQVDLHVDKENVTRVSYWSNNKSFYYWNFWPGEKIELILITDKHADYSKGIPFLPTLDGALNPDNCIQPGTLAFCTAFANFKDAPPLIEEIALTQKGKILVEWSEMSLGGTKSLRDLWEKVSAGYPSRECLPMTFQIEPNPHLPILDDFNAMRFVKKAYQSEIVSGWEKQIAEFAEGLVKRSVK
jgi:hypothetical protein